MRPDVKKSIATGKIYFKRDIMDQVIRCLCFFAFILMLPICALTCFVALFKIDIMDQSSVIVASIGFSAFMILKVMSPNTLKMTRVSNYAIRKENIIQAIRQFKWDIAFDDPNYLIIIPNSIYHQITIINADSDILISSVIFSKMDWFAFSEKKYLNIFLNKIGYTPANQALKLTE